VGDFNNDGHQDLAVTNEESSNVSILLGMARVIRTAEHLPPALLPVAAIAISMAMVIRI